MTALTIDELDSGLEPEPLPAPAPPPADVYRLLQVLPTAPRDLIDEAYWVLGARAMRMPGTRGQSARYIAALNWAYETAARALADQALYDEYSEPEPEPARRAWPRFFFSETPDAPPTPKHLSYYDLLCVQPYADAKIIDLAAIVILRTSGGFSSADAAMRDLIRMARRVLMNPKTRSEHDLRLGLARPDVAQPPAQAPSVPAAAWPQSNPSPESADDAGQASSANLPVSLRPAQAEEEAAEVTLSLPPSRPTTANEEFVATPVADCEPPAASLRPAPPTSAPKMEIASSPSEGTLSGATAAPQSEQNADAVTHKQPRHRNRMRGWFADRMARARRDQRQRDPSDDAAGDSDDSDEERLRSLRDGDAASGSFPWGARETFAELRFISGPRLGEAIRIGHTVLTVGEAGESDEPLADAATVGPRYGRIWQQGDHFIFRQLDDADVKISGEQLLIPVVVLEHGDQIEFANHVIEFHQHSE